MLSSINFHINQSEGGFKMKRKIMLIDMPTAIEFFLDTLKSDNVSSGTIEAYKKDLTKFNEFLKLKKISFVNEITHITIYEFIDFLQRKMKFSNSTIYRYIACLRKFFKILFFAGKVGFIATDRVDFEKPKKKKSFFVLNYDEIDRIIDAAKKQENLLRRYCDVALITLLAYTGARRSDALSLNWNNIDFFNREITIYVQKIKKEIKVPMHERVFEALKEYYSFIKPNYYDPVFLSNNYERLSTTSANNYFRKYVKESKVIENRILKIQNSNMSEEEKQQEIKEIKVTFHTLKHSFITKCFQDGKSAEEISKLTGNQDLDTLLYYRTNTREDLYKPAEILNNHRKVSIG